MAWETYCSTTLYMEHHLPYGITQYYLPPDTGERTVSHPTLTSARQTGTRFNYSEGW